MARIVRQHASRAPAVLGLALAAAAAVPSFGQENVLALPPRLDEGPGATRLAEPPADRRDALEEVVVTADSQWRLPDLGSSWRARAEAERPAERMQLAFLPLYDPERDPVTFDALGINREFQRVGFIEIFRVRFGRRP